MARVLPSGRGALQEEGAQISKRGAPKYHGRLPGGAAQIFASTLHVEIHRQCGHHPPLSTLSLPLPTAQIHCGHNSLPKLLLKVCEAGPQPLQQLIQLMVSYHGGRLVCYS